MASTLSTITLPSPSHISPSTIHASVSFPTKTLQLPIRTPKLHRRRATFVRPLAAVDAPEKVVQLGDEISTLTLADAQKLVEYLQDKLGISSPSWTTFSGASTAARGRTKVARRRWSLGVRMGSCRVLVGKETEACAVEGEM
ncbi:hypothetical protein P3S67_025497 [Capsicum chacoense]